MYGIKCLGGGGVGRRALQRICKLNNVTTLSLAVFGYFFGLKTWICAALYVYVCKLYFIRWSTSSSFIKGLISKYSGITADWLIDLTCNIVRLIDWLINWLIGLLKFETESFEPKYSRASDWLMYWLIDWFFFFLLF